MTAPALYSWFANTACRYPDAVALEVAGTSMTYAELSDLVERTAGMLLRAHHGVPTSVALLAARSLPAYAGYLAALRLGAVVVPLNPAYPVRRNLTIAAAAGADVVIADESAAKQSLVFAAGHSAARTDPVTVVDLVGDWAGRLAPTAPEDLPAPGGSGDGVAYLLFTSGSTGTPKGVPIRHANISAYLHHIVNEQELEPGTRWTNTAELTFDLSVSEMFAAWGSGGAVVPPRSRGDLLNPVRYVNECSLTHWFSVPSVVSMASRLRLLRPGCMPTLRHSMFGGEQLTVAQAGAWAEAAPHTAISNVYGPTENTIVCVGYRLPRKPTQWPVTSNDAIPIGHALPTTELLVVDPDGYPAIDGELLVRGRQLFPGYHNPADNAGRFAAFDGRAADIGTEPVTGEHWYRTGDRVRVEDGVLVYVGRLDHQLKLHGCRVELGEIEAVLRRHPGVGEAVVLPVADDSGDPVLVACYTGDIADEDDLASIAAATLPTYMRPRRFRWISEFPLNFNGKIDRATLAAHIAAPEPAAQSSP